MKKATRPGSGRRGGRWADHYTHLARRQRYPARSVFKLKEIQQKFRLLKKGNCVLDLGCAPGSWMMLTAEIVGPGGTVVGIDLKPLRIQLPPQAVVHIGDVHSQSAAFWQELPPVFDVVLSDMAPATSGNKATDSLRSLALCEQALAVSRQRLRRGGHLVCKLFTGAGSDTFAADMRSAFGRFARYKPKSSRKASKELFLIGIGYLG